MSGPREAEADALRQRADACRSLADRARTPAGRAALNTIADHFDTDARRIDPTGERR